MSRVRDEIMQKLWRGQNPFAASRAGDGAPDLQGWGSQHRYLSQAIATLRPSIVVEVGVWKGASVVHMASRLRDLAIDGVVIAIDTWLGSWDHWVQDQWFHEVGSLESTRGILATFLVNVRNAGLEGYIVPLRLDSINAAQVLRHFGIFPDLVHLDAAHDEASVLNDLQHWWPLLKPGGRLIGDDYRAGNDWPGVKQAFDDYFRPLGLLPLENADDKCIVAKPHAGPQAGPAGNDLLAALKQTGTAVSAWREARRLQHVELIESETLGFEERLARFLRWEGPNWEPGLVRMINRIARDLQPSIRELSRNELLGPQREITAEASAVIPGLSEHFLRPVPATGFPRFEPLAETENPYWRFALPPGLGKNLGLTKAPPLAVYRVEGADLFLTPLGYQLYRAKEATWWPAATTRPYPIEAVQGPHVTTQKTVVLVQDGFEGTNFSHFLLDWMTRLGLFLDAGLAAPSDCVFVMGGAPSEFHFHVIRAMCEIYSLHEEQFCFPQAPQVWHIEQPLWYFSDLTETIMHPAHMANPRSVAIIRNICSRIRTQPSTVKRLYISRDDTPLRRVSNEAELSHHLRPLGFVEVQFASMPLLEQIRVVRGAEVIVAPHGMGLTHLVFHEGRPLVIELHNPTIGSDAYAFMSLALGFHYRAVLGTALPGPGHHFTVRPADVTRALAEAGILPPQASGDGLHPAIRTVFYRGVQSTASSEMPAADPVVAECRHVRDDPALQPDNNVGWLEASGLIEGALYHGSCEIWVPAGFNGQQVVLVGGGHDTRGLTHADLTRRDQWQTVSVDTFADRDVVNFVLRCDAGAGAYFYSRNWRAGAGRTGARTAP